MPFYHIPSYSILFHPLYRHRVHSFVLIFDGHWAVYPIFTQTQTNKNQTRTSKNPDQEHHRANTSSTIFLQKNVQHSQSKCQSQISQIATLKCQENVTFLFQRKLKRLVIFDFSFIWWVSCRRLDEPHLRYHSSRKQPGVTTTKVPLISVSESPLICR